MYQYIRYEKLQEQQQPPQQHCKYSPPPSPSQSLLLNNNYNNNHHHNHNNLQGGYQPGTTMKMSEQILDLSYFQDMLLNKSTTTTTTTTTTNNDDQQIIDSIKLPSLSVLDFYRDKTIFVTGATGFIGKVLVEKLLRIGVIRKCYVLLRSKRDKSPQERLDELLSHSPVFSFHAQQLDLNKIQAISGDITEPDLGLNDQDRKLLQQEVDIVFHSAASVQFKGKLKVFLEQNVLGTDRVMKLCTEMIGLKAVVYVSTAYANCNLSYVEEKVYPFDFSYENVDEFIEETLWLYGNLSPKAGHPALCGRPNCYTFSKALAEWLVTKKYSHYLPVIICRPSIVTHSAHEPAVGWCDTKNGVSGAMILGGLGIARTMILNMNCKADVIPVDYVVNATIVLAAHTGTRPPAERKQVVHLTTGERNPITWGEMLDQSRLAVESKPFLKQIRPLAKKPVVTDGLMGRLSHQFTKIFSHYCFALIADGMIMLCGYRPFLLHITKRMHQGFDTLQPFTNREWRFQHENYPEIYQLLSPKERDLFRSDVSQINWLDYIDDATLGTRRYLLKEDDSTIDEAVKRQKFLNWAYGSIEALAYLGIFSTIWWNLFTLYE